MKKLLIINIILLFTLDTFTVKAQWQQTNGPYGFSLSYGSTDDYRGSSVMAVEKSGIYLFAGVHGGVMVSTNNGNIWTRSLEVDSAFALKYNGINLYAGTESGFYLSTNNGATWTQSNAGLTNTTVLSFAVNGSSLFAGTRGGVFVSTNNGVSWSASYIGMPSTSVNALLVDGLNIFAGTNQGVYRSTNNGLTWGPMNSGMPSVYNIITSFTKIGINIFAGTLLNSSYSHIYLTTNGGINWTSADIGLPTPYPGTGSFVSSVGMKLFAGSTYGMYQSLDNGATWTTNNNSFGKIITLFTDGTNLYQGGKTGLYLSTDNGNSWKNLGLGAANTVNALATNGTKIFAATGNGIYFTSNDGNTWEKSLIPSMPSGLINQRAYIPRSFNAIAVNGSNVFASSPDGSGGGAGGQGTLWRSIDGGISWDRIISDTLSNDTIISALGIWSSKVFAGTNTGLYSSVDNGNSWTLLTNGLPTGGTYYRTIVPSGPVIFVTNMSGTYLSTDGVNWTNANVIPAGFMSAGVVLSANGPNIYANTCFSNNYGSTWTPWTLPYNTNSLIVKGDTLISLRDRNTGSDNSWISLDNGATWDTISQGIEDCQYMGALIVKGNNVFAASGEHWGMYSFTDWGCEVQNNGVFRADLSTIVLGITEAKENSDLLVYPNPTNSSLTINTSVNYSSIQIVNMLGQFVFTKEKSISLNVSSLPGGIYFIQLVDTKGSVIGKEKFVKE